MTDDAEDSMDEVLERFMEETEGVTNCSSVTEEKNPWEYIFQDIVNGTKSLWSFNNNFVSYYQSAWMLKNMTSLITLFKSFRNERHIGSRND